MDATSMAVAQAWVNAANACDGDRLTALSDPNVEIVGPRGSARGPAVLRDWLGRAGVTLATRCGYGRRPGCRQAKPRSHRVFGCGTGVWWPTNATTIWPKRWQRQG